MLMTGTSGQGQAVTQTSEALLPNRQTDLWQN